MERQKCKLCFKSFSNGRALGGHMRSHMLNLSLPAKPQQEHGQLPAIVSPENKFVCSSEEEDYDEDQSGSYVLRRENPQRSIRLVDPEFSVGVDPGSVLVQDRESETESSKNPTRRRSKRSRKSMEYQYSCREVKEHQVQELDNVKNVKNSANTDCFEPEPVSSVSDITEEDVAFSLMMLSRDRWKKKENQNQTFEKLSNHGSFQEFEEDDEVEESDESKSEEFIKTMKNSNNTGSSGTKGKYKCETCKKVFKSYQALGGHRASHKKLKLQAQIQEEECFEQENAVVAEKKVHECPYCYRVFSSGQALGGHKRSHVISAANVTTTLNARISIKFGDNLRLIDLNLPAPVEEDDSSAVSDAEFVNHNKIKR